MKKNLIQLLFLPSVVAAFYLGGTFSTNANRKIRTPSEGSVSVDQIHHVWNVEQGDTDTPHKIEMFIRNVSDADIAGTIGFTIELDGSGLEKSFLESIIERMGEEEFLSLRKTNKRSEAIYNYIKRGKRLPDEMEYEPISENDFEGYETVAYKEIKLLTGESTKIELEIQIPPKYRGYLLSVKNKILYQSHHKTPDCSPR
jgi:hypothetical protein